MTSAATRDHYSALGVDRRATTDEIRRAFRQRLFEIHPDKSTTPIDPTRLDAVMAAFEVLGDTDRRNEYDQVLATFARHELPLSSLKHVTESERPVDRARAILFLLLEERTEEALERIRAHGESARTFLESHLDLEELIDLGFLVGEALESTGRVFEALRWLQWVLDLEKPRRRHRPCYPEVIERTKKLIVQRIVPRLDPRSALEYLRRVEELGLDRVESAEVHKRRAQCFLDLDMKVEAARQLGLAMALQPQIKGTQKLREGLSGYL